MCCSSQGRGEVSHQPSMVSPAFVPVARLLCQTAGWARGQRGHRCKKLLAPFSIITLPQGSCWCWGAHPAPRACRLCLGTVGCEIREVFSLSPTWSQQRSKVTRATGWGRVPRAATPQGCHRLSTSPTSTYHACHRKNPSPGGFPDLPGPKEISSFYFSLC